MAGGRRAVIRALLVQMVCEKGDVAGNLARTAGWIDEAAARGADVVAFPEMSLTGYEPRAALRRDGPEIAALRAATARFDGVVLAGFVEAHESGDKPFITQLVARRGEALGFYRKISIFDEEAPYFSAGVDDPPVFVHNGVTFGVAICADIENEGVFARCAAQGARVVFEVAAPGLYGEQSTRDWAEGYAWWEGECADKLGRYARALGLWIAVATQAGRTIDEDFPGGGFVFDPTGARVFATDGWEPGALLVEIGG